MRGLWARFGISRKTGHKWLERYHEAGAAGLTDRSRVRLSQTLTIDPGTAGMILALRKARPKLGPRKLLARLAMDHPEAVLAGGEHGGRPAAPGGCRGAPDPALAGTRNKAPTNRALRTK
jgi:homeodomain-containing protein